MRPLLPALRGPTPHQQTSTGPTVTRTWQARTSGPTPAPLCPLRRHLYFQPTACAGLLPGGSLGDVCHSSLLCCRFGFSQVASSPPHAGSYVPSLHDDHPPDSLCSRPAYTPEVQGATSGLWLTCWSGCSLLFDDLIMPLNAESLFSGQVNTLVIFMGFVLLPTQPS